MLMELAQISAGLSALALVIAVLAVSQGSAPAQDQFNLTEEQVRSIAGSLDDEQPSRYGEPLYAGSSMGYVIDFASGESFYVSGDSGPTWEMRSYIRDQLEPTVAFFSAGNVYTSDMETAAWQASLVDSDVAIPIHYGTFPALEQDATPFENTLADLRAQGETNTTSMVLDTADWTTVNGVETMWVGHGSLMFQSPDGTNIMVDPWIMTNPEAPQSWKDDLSNVPRVDLILVTHGHTDHYTPSTIKELQDMYNSTVVAEWELAAHMINQGFSNVVGVNKGGDLDRQTLVNSGATGGVQNMEDGMNIHTVWAKHSSSPATTLDQAFGITVDGEIAR